MNSFRIELNEDQKNKVNLIINHVPKNEYEVIRFFSKIEEIIGFSNIRIFEEYPDASGIYNGVEYDIEFEVLSSNFIKHGHKKDLCNLIICWINDADVGIPTLELSTLGKNWMDERNQIIQKYWILLQTKKRGDINDEINQMMNIYNFDHDEAVANWMGITKRGLKQTYGSVIDIKPECIGGKMTCEKRDIDAKYIDK